MKKKYSLHLTALVFLSCSMFTANALAARPSYFARLDETRSGNLSPFTKWTGMRSRFDQQIEWRIQECGKRKYFSCQVKEWKNLLDNLQDAPLATKVQEVNRYINAFPYILDQVNWGMEDYWETPYEHISINGDCEDYAIAKYYSLRYLGVPEDRLRIMIVQDNNLGGIIHAILGVYMDSGELLILDNQIKKVVSALKIYHYRPIYSLNERFWWAYHVR